MPAQRLPSFQYYPADWRKDPGVQSLDFHTRGIWHEMICLMHETEERGVLLLNGRPMPEDALARMLGLDKQILTTALTTLLTYGVTSQRDSDGAFVCRRMVRDEHLRQVRAESGKMGGNPALVKQKPTTGLTTPVNQIPTPSSSSSSSSSITEESVGADAPAPAPPSVVVEQPTAKPEPKKRQPRAAPPRAEALPANHPLADLINPGAPAARVQALTAPLTAAEADRLLAEYPTVTVRGILLDMANWKPLLEKSDSVNLTARKWLRKDGAAAANAAPARHQPQQHAIGGDFAATQTGSAQERARAQSKIIVL